MPLHAKRCNRPLRFWSKKPVQNCRNRSEAGRNCAVGIEVTQTRPGAEGGGNRQPGWDDGTHLHNAPRTGQRTFSGQQNTLKRLACPSSRDEIWGRFLSQTNGLRQSDNGYCTCASPSNRKQNKMHMVVPRLMTHEYHSGPQTLMQVFLTQGQIAASLQGSGARRHRNGVKAARGLCRQSARQSSLGKPPAAGNKFSHNLARSWAIVHDLWDQRGQRIGSSDQYAIYGCAKPSSAISIFQGTRSLPHCHATQAEALTCPSNS